MANLKQQEKDFFCELFRGDSGSGYVLDFTNSSFRKVIFDYIQIDVYAGRYQVYSSKMKKLEALMDFENDRLIGKMFLELMQYMVDKSRINAQNRTIFDKCTIIANRLIGKTIVEKPKKSVCNLQQKTTDSSIDFPVLMTGLVELTTYQGTCQKRGFAFEKYLERLFDECKMEPRGSFRVNGEQIDGSIKLEGETYLIEAKWQSCQTGISDLSRFNDKVTAKSKISRGIFISFSGYTENALQEFPKGRSIAISLVTVQEIAIALGRNENIERMLKEKVRKLQEGEFYYVYQ